MQTLLHNIGIDTANKWISMLLSGSNILIILILSWLLIWLSRRLIRTFKVYITQHTLDPGSIKRAETLSHVFSNTAIVIILLITGMLILGETGISIAPILAAAGVAGVAVGFGAQSLIKDYFNGIFLLVEDQIRHGEVVEISQKKGQVEEVTLRYVKLRDFEGSVHFIPNSTITTVTNRSRDFSNSVIDIGVAYRENIDEVYELMRKVGAEMRLASEWKDKIIDDIEIVGIDNLADSAVIVRCRFKVMPLEQWGVRREFLYRIKKTFDASGIEIPYPHLTLYAGQTKAEAMTPAFKIQSRPMDIG